MLIYCFRLSGQEFVHYDITEGLSSIEVNDIIENDNFLWIATTDGLNRFDGRNFRVYKRENGAKNSLGENNIETLFLDSSGLLWIGFKTGGVDIYDPRHNVFLHLDELIDQPCPSRVICIREDSAHNIWLGTWEQGVYRLTPRPGAKKSFTAEVSFPGYIVSAILEKPAGFIRVGTYSGIYSYQLEKNSWADTAIYNMSVTQFLDTGKDNAFWCSTWSSGLNEISWGAGKPRNMFVSRSFTGKNYMSIHRLLSAGTDKFFLGTWGGGVRVTDINHPDDISPLSPEKCKAPLVNSLYRDRHGNVWIGTYGGGLYKYIPERSYVRHFPADGILPSPAVSLARFGSGMLLAGTQGKGVFLCDPGEGRLIPKFGNEPSSEFSNYILSLYSDDNIILVGHDGYGVPYLTGRKRKPDFSFREVTGVSQLEKTTAFYPDGYGTLWIGTKQNGLFSTTIEDGYLAADDFIHYDTFGRDEITGFALLDQDRLFISSHNGLFIFNTKEKAIEKEGSLIVNELVYCLSRDELNKTLWIGSSTGLMKIPLDNPYSVTEVLPRDLIPQGAVRTMITDRGGNLWFAISGRLFCLADHGNRIYEADRSLFENKAVISSASADLNGKEFLFFGTTEKLAMLDPAGVLAEADLPGIIFTGLEIDHRHIDVGEMVYRQVALAESSEYVKSLRISHKSKWISFHFVEKEWGIFRNRYQYRLNGFSDEWQYLDISGPVTFSRLDPGKYELQVRQYDALKEPAILWSVDITVLPLWRKADWFYGLLALFLLALTGVIIIIIVRYLRKRQLVRLHEIEKQKNEELLREKEEFFTGLSHDIMTPLSLIISPVNDLLRTSPEDDPKKEKLEIISRNTSFLSDIFGTILDFKRVALAENEVKETDVEIVSFCRVIMNAFGYLAKSRQIELNYISSVDSLNILTDNVKLERILYNLLSNAIKYTPDGGSVSLHFHTDIPGKMSFIVTDTGCGMDVRNQAVFEKFYRSPGRTSASNPHGLGLGLYIVREFVQLLGGDIKVNSSPGSGTEIILTLPCKQSQAADHDEGKRHPASFNDDLSTILLVEDNDEMREYITGKLSAGFNVIQARNGIEALGIIEKYLPEIIITDVMMPGMDGLALCREVKQNDRYSDLFVVMLSARISTEDELLAYKAGADIYLKKPLDSELLLNQMKNIHFTRQRRKSQLLANIISEEVREIELDPKESFIRKAMKVIEENIMDTDFKVDRFSAEMCMSNTVLHRKFRLYTGTTPNQFIRLVRLRRSVMLLRNSNYTIAEIANLTGFNQSHYFIKCFREVYNETPGSFREKGRDR